MEILRGLRRVPAAMALLLLSSVGLVYLGLSLAIPARMPSDGMLLAGVEPSALSIGVVLSPMPGGPQAGDRVLAVDGRTPWEWMEWALAGGPAAEWRVGQTVTYRLLRGRETLEVPVTLVPFPLGRLLLVRLGIYASTLLALLVGGYTLLALSHDVVARLFFLASASLLFVDVFPFQVTVLVTPGLFLLQRGIDALGASLLCSALLHLFLIFPVVKPVLRGRERWLNGLHLVNPLLSVLIGVAFGRTPGERVVLGAISSTWIGLTMLIATVVSVVHTYATARQTTARGQIRWVAWGMVVGLLPYLVFTGLPEIITGRALLSLEITSLFTMLVPVTIAVAIARYRLFDIDLLIHRSLVYALLALLFTCLYLLLVAVLNPIVLRLTGRPNDTVVVFISTLVVSTAFWALRSTLARTVARLFHRARLDPRLLVVEMSEGLGNTVRLSEVAALLTRAIPERIGVRHGELMVLSEDRARLEQVGGDGPPLLVKDTLDSWIERGGQPVLTSRPPPWLSPAVLDHLAQGGLELAFPLLVSGRMVGLWSLGPRLSGPSYTSEEVRMLGTLALQAAVTVQNARLVRRLEAHSQWLEEEVERRIHDLERERNRLNVILQNMADGLLVTDLTGRVLLTNPAFEYMVRRPSRVLLGQSLDQALAFPDLSGLIGRAQEEQGPTVTGDLTLGERVLKASALALRDHSGVVTVLRDITHEVEVDRMKSEFISTVSHELRTPLTSVLGFAKLIRRTFNRAIVPLLADAPEDTRAQKAARRISENIDIIVAEGERLTRLINDVLDIAKMEAGKIEWHDQPVKIHELIEQTIQSATTLAADKGLVLESYVQPDLPPLVADPDRIRQVLINLLSNAAKFTDQGNISFTARLLPPGSTVHGWEAPTPTTSALLVSVSDTGIGIAPEDVPHLFLRFQQLGGDTLTHKHKGTGLGLAICRQIVAHYGGAIWVESAPGYGSTFSFVLPAAAQEEVEMALAPAPASAVAPAVPEEQPACILVADDEPHIRELLSQTLEEAGYRTLVVSGGAEAVAQTRRHHPDLVLLDVMMPGISGFDALQILKADPTTSDIPTLLISVSDNRQQALALGADAYLAKPVEGAQLLDTVLTLLAHSRAAAPA